ncbi:zinc finger protein RFP-like isoform X2 [Tiliqua scincoides]|uniref:zinc finger protein RFP-like isoform X2 n=1 Tax=Tiliqua scincoides TaxID=71010 RepID=UPI003462D5D4
MAADSYGKRLRDEVTCPVCLEYFTDPVTLDCGHNFCKGCITMYWGEAPSDATCPQCRERVQPGNLRPNRQLASVVQIAKELNEPPKLAASGWGVCERHQEPLKLFCQDDQAPICVVCDRSKEHRPHRVVPVEEAAQEIKIQMQEEREKTAAAFRQVRQFLEEQEKLLLAGTEEVEKEIAMRREEHLVRLSGELSSLDSLIQELEEKQQQSASELLQNLGSILERCQKESFENPGAFPVALKWRIHDFCDINPFLETLMKKFKDSLVSGLQLQEAKVTLDPDTAHPKLILSEDHKSVRYGDEWQDLCDKPERFDYWCFVLGREGFTAGRHFWEVTVGSEEAWSVGIARKSVRRKGDFDCSPKEGIWDMGMWAGKCRVSNPVDNASLSLSQELKRIRVTLNCTGGRVSFFDADTGAQLYLYSEASFCEETLLPFFYVVNGGHLTLCP